MNLFLLLHALGLGHDLHGQHLLPIGTVYDPFVCRGLDALIYGLYSGSRFVVVGTPAGITLAPEGGAHQSTITPSIGLELPGADVRRAGVRPGARLAAVRRARRSRAAGRRVAVPAPVDATDRPGAVPRRPSSGSAPSVCAPTCWPAATGLHEPHDRLQPSCWPRAGRSCPRSSPRRTHWPTRARRRSCST